MALLLLASSQFSRQKSNSFLSVSISYSVVYPIPTVCYFSICLRQDLTMYLSLAGQEFTMQTRLTSNTYRSSCLCLPSAVLGSKLWAITPGYCCSILSYVCVYCWFSCLVSPMLVPQNLLRSLNVPGSCGACLWSQHSGGRGRRISDFRPTWSIEQVLLDSKGSTDKPCVSLLELYSVYGLDLEEQVLL